METDFSQGLVDDPALNNIASINTRQTLLIVNDFITHTVDFMNKFSSLSEHKLYAVSQKTAKLEVLISLLEAKLESIPLHQTGYIGAPTTVSSAQLAVDEAGPIIPDGAQPSPPGPPPGPPPPSSTISPPPNPPPSSSPALPPPQVIPETPPEATPVAAADPNATLIKDDPRYKKYFDMMSRGVPKFAVMQKYAIDNDGGDSSFLDLDPNTPVASGGALIHIPDAADDSD